MAYDPYISPNQAVVSGSVAADGENTTDAPSGKKVKGQLVPGTAEPKKSTSQPAGSGGGGGTGSNQAAASTQSTESKSESTASKAESESKSTSAKK